MSGADTEVFNTLERSSTGDLNDLQSIQARFASELMQFSQVVRVGGFQAEATRNVVLGGLTPSPSGNDVAISPGALAQLSATLSPVPGPLDSDYRLAWLDVPLTVTMPAPGVTTYYLIEAQMVEVVSSTALRDVWTPPNGPFTPVLLTKQTRRTIATQLLTGAAGQAPIPSGGDWVPIAIVRRPPGGGPVVPSDIDDVRPAAEWGRRRPATPTVLSGNVEALSGTSFVRLTAQIDGAGGVRSADYINTVPDLSAPQILSPTTTLVGSTWFYLYLANWQTLTPRYADAAISRQGVLVLSDVPPTATTRLNAFPLDLPAPYGVTQAPTLTAYLVGAFYRNAANTGWVPTWSEDLEHWRMSGGPTVSSGTIVAGNNTIVPAVGDFPTGHRAVGVNVIYLGGSATAGFSPANLRTLSMRDGAGVEFLDAPFATVLETAGGGGQLTRATLPKQFSTDTFVLFVGGGAVDPTTAANISVNGYVL